MSEERREGRRTTKTEKIIISTNTNTNTNNNNTKSNTYSNTNNRDTKSNTNSNSNKDERGISEMKELWGIFIFAVIGATATSYAIGQLRRTADFFFTQVPKSQTSWKGGNSKSFRSSFQEESWRRYNRRLQEEYEEEMQRVERIRRMQSAFNRERNKQKRAYERWSENDPWIYYQQFQREDWYSSANPSFGYQRTHFRDTRASAARPLSHHYTVLGLDRLRTKPYTDDEIKTAFRAKAKQFHPDQNQDNKESAEAKFKEIMASYEAIKTERKNK